MLTKEDNEYLCRTGPGTPMGNLLRRYWLPTLLCSEVPDPDCPPVRVKVLGEDLVAFRDTNGQIGLLEDHCAHRGASLFFGRNEECGLRCVYHGWKYDVSGQCVEMPNEPAESDFKTRIRTTAYPTLEAAGMVWAYIGPSAKQPAFRHLPGLSIPRDQWDASKTPINCNYMQSNEGDIDSSHISFLHRSFGDFDPYDDGTDRPGYPSAKMSFHIRAMSRAARIEVQETDFGFRYAGIRRTPARHQHIRMTLHVLPNITYVANPLNEARVGPGIIIVPRDDESCWRFTGRSQVGLFLDEQGKRVRTAANDYLIDREAQHAASYTGIAGGSNQDYMVTESMGPIYDRTREHLGTTDIAIAKLRELLIRAARNLEQGIDPPALDPSFAWDRLRSEEQIIPIGADWRTLATDADENYRRLVLHTP